MSSAETPIEITQDTPMERNYECIRTMRKLLCKEAFSRKHIGVINGVVKIIGTRFEMVHWLSNISPTEQRMATFEKIDPDWEPAIV